MRRAKNSDVQLFASPEIFVRTASRPTFGMPRISLNEAEPFPTTRIHRNASHLWSRLRPTVPSARYRDAFRLDSLPRTPITTTPQAESLSDSCPSKNLPHAAP